MLRACLITLHSNFKIFKKRDSTNSLASAVVQFVPRACGKLNLAAIISEGLSTTLYQIARSKIKGFRK